MNFNDDLTDNEAVKKMEHRQTWLTCRDQLARDMERVSSQQRRASKRQALNNDAMDEMARNAVLMRGKKAMEENRLASAVRWDCCSKKYLKHLRAKAKRMGHWSKIHEKHQQDIDVNRDFNEAFGIDVLAEEEAEEDKDEAKMTTEVEQKSSKNSKPSKNSDQSRTGKKQHVRIDPETMWTAVVATHMAFGVSPKKGTALYQAWVNDDVLRTASYIQRDAYKGIGVSRATRALLQIAAGDDPAEGEDDEKELYGVDVVMEKAEKFYTDWAKHQELEKDKKERERLEKEEKLGVPRKASLSRRRSSVMGSKK